jgi:2-oxoglutarate ferredoxin oxidoreductase subunit gamma
MVKISDDYIASPIVTKADIAFIMSDPSLTKFEGRLKKNGLMILNTSMATSSVKRKDIDVIKVPATDEAIKLGNAKVANMIAIGVYMARTELFGKDILHKVIKDMAMGREDLISINIDALERGMELGKR